MRRGALSLLAALSAAATLPAAARADGIAASVDRTETTVEEPLLLTVTVDGSQSAEPHLPPLPDFEARAHGRATQVQIINGHLSTGATYTYQLTPRRAGTFTIGPVTVELAGRPHQSEPFAVAVRAAATPPGAPGSGTAGSAAAAALFVTGEVAPTEIYAGQQAVYTWRFYRRQRVGNAQVQLPDFDGLLSEALGEQREYETHVGGQPYHVVEMRRALFAPEPGTVHLSGSSLTCDVYAQERRGDGLFNSPFDEFFGRGPRQSRTLRSPPVQLHVLPLPPAPPGYTGLVGEFHAEATLTKTALQVGESTTLTVTLSGSGNLQHMADPSFAEVAGLKAYDDRPAVQLNARGNQLTGSKTFKRALVPTRAGELVIPAMHFVYFDPAARSYRDAATASFTLHAAGGSAAPQPPVGAAPPAAAAAPPGKIDVRILGDDILPTYDRIDALYPQRIGPLQVLVWLATLAVPWAVYVAFALWHRARTDAAHSASRRRRGALRQGREQVRAIEQMLAAGRVAEAATAASRALRAYLGLKLALEGGAMTAGEVRARLIARGCEAPLAGQAESFLQRCEGAQYSAAPGTVSLYTTLADELRALLEALDRRLRR